MQMYSFVEGDASRRFNPSFRWWCLDRTRNTRNLLKRYRLWRLTGSWPVRRKEG